MQSAYLAIHFAQIFFEQNELYNGKGDAFRHCLWNALGAAKLGKSLMSQLSNAHEVYDPGETPRPLEKSMDLYNNDIGLDIGDNILPIPLLIVMNVKNAVANGKTKYIYPRASNGAVIPNISYLIPTNQ